MTTDQIGILGSGDVGKALGAGFARHGYDVMVGTRDPSKLEEWLASAPNGVAVGSVADAARHGEVVVLATNGKGTLNALDLAGPDTLAGKLVLDATNPLEFGDDGSPGLFVGVTDSLGERVQRKLPEAEVVKCFNTVSNVQMIDPEFAEGTPPMLIAGDDDDAKRRADELVRAVGWPGVLDVGGIEAARWLEALVPLWVRAGTALDTWRHAFKAVQ